MVLCCICELPLRAKGGKRCPHCRKVVEHETRDRAKCNGLCMGSSRRHPSQDKSKDSKDRGYCAGACAASGGTGGRGGGSKGTDSCILCKNDAQTQAKRTSGNAVMLLEKCNTGCHTSYHVHEKCRKKEIKSVRKSLSKKDKATVDKYEYNWCFLCAQGVDFHISSKSRHTGTYGTLIGQPKEIINMTDLYTIHSSVQVAVDYSDYSVTVPTTTMKKERAAAVSSGTTFAMPDSVTCQISERTGCSCILEDGIKSASKSKGIDGCIDFSTSVRNSPANRFAHLRASAATGEELRGRASPMNVPASNGPILDNSEWNDAPGFAVWKASPLARGGVFQAGGAVATAAATAMGAPLVSPLVAGTKDATGVHKTKVTKVCDVAFFPSLLLSPSRPLALSLSRSLALVCSYIHPHTLPLEARHGMEGRNHD